MEWNKENGDRRKEPRYKISIQTQITTPDASIAATANNISGGGMEIQLHKGINPYTSLTVSIQIHEEYHPHQLHQWNTPYYSDSLMNLSNILLSLGWNFQLSMNPQWD